MVIRSRNRRSRTYLPNLGMVAGAAQGAPWKRLRGNAVYTPLSNLEHPEDFFTQINLYRFLNRPALEGSGKAPNHSRFAWGAHRWGRDDDSGAAEKQWEMTAFLVLGLPRTRSL